MNVLLTIFYAVLILGFLVFIHEGGHYLSARLFGVRVTEFTLGMPGPSIGFTKGGTRFGVTPFLLGGYAKVCGMEPGEMSPHLQVVLEAVYCQGSATVEDVAVACGITKEEACSALDELVEWGSVVAPGKHDTLETYRTPAYVPSKRQIRTAQNAGKPTPVRYEQGQARFVGSAKELFESEYCQQYRSLPFWKRSVILVAGVAVNLLFAMLLFVVLFSLVGVDVQDSSGAVNHITLNPAQSVWVGFSYIGLVFQMVAGLFNPETAAQTVSQSTSIIGIAAMSKEAFDIGLVQVIQFVATISVSLGVMNLIPIPPLDGGRLVIEIFQKITCRTITPRALNFLSLAGVALFLGFFLIMVNQDIQRIVTGVGFGG